MSLFLGSHNLKKELFEGKPDRLDRINFGLRRCATGQ